MFARRPLLFQRSPLGRYDLEGASRLLGTRLRRTVCACACFWAFAIAAPSTEFPAVVDLTRLNAATGSEIQGNSVLDEAAHSLSAGGDLNGDGAPDLAVGAHEASPRGRTLAGAIHVVFGGTELGRRFSLGNLDGSNGFRISGLEDFDTLGKAVSLRGDINGDGLADLVLGAPFADPDGTDGAGIIYVIYGSSDPFPEAFDLTTLDGTNGFAIHGATVLDQIGSDVDLGADLDNDGFTDLAIGAPGANDPTTGDLNSGEAYVLYGRADFPAVFKISDHLPENGGDGSELLVLRNGEAAAEVGVSTALSEDLNADGLDDLIIGAWLSDPLGRVNAGAVYVVFGQSARPISVDLTLLDGTDGFALYGAADGDEAGYTVGHGDVNLDDVHDLLIGSPKASPSGLTTAGEAYVVFGGSVAQPATLDLSTLAQPTGVRIPGIASADENGWSVSGSEDVNGDGFCDLVIGARSVGPDQVGNAYLVYGNDSWEDTFDLTTLDGSNGTRFEGSGQTGFSLTAYADLNGDSTTDLVIGAPKGDPNGLTNAGIAYMLYGPRFNLALDGACPDAIRLQIRHATPNSAVELYWSAELGEGTVPSGPCAGTATDLESPQLVRELFTTDGGSLFLDRVVPLSFCGVHVQVIDPTDCSTTDPEQIPDFSVATN